MKKVFSFMVMALACTMMQAAEYYVTPEGSGQSARGTSWEDAVSMKNFSLALASIPAGSTFYFKGGTYTFASSTDVFKITKTMTLIGGFDPTATGKVTELPKYPSATPTIFDGDVNQDGVASAGDVVNMFYVDLTKDSTQTVTIQGFDICHTYAVDALKEDNLAGAIYTLNGKVIIKNCNIYQNGTDYNGAPAINIYGSQTLIQECALTDNYAYCKGGALRLSSYSVRNEGGEVLYKVRSKVVLDRSLVADNKIDLTQKYGGGIQVTAGDFYALNSTITGNQALCNGAGISCGAAHSVTLISCTLGNNIAARAGKAGDSNPFSYGASIRMTEDGVLKLANTISVENGDDGTKTNPSIFTEKIPTGYMLSDFVTSGGYNIVGTLFNGSNKDDQLTNIWDFETDDNSTIDDVNTFDDVFGAGATLQDKGGCTKVLVPATANKGITLTTLQQLVKDWFPTTFEVDATVDQRGYNRDATTTTGAYAADAQSGLTETTSTQIGAQKILKNGQLYIVRDNKVFNAQGVQF